MSYKIVFAFNGIVALVIGVGYLIMTEVVLKFFGTQTTVPVQVVSRFFGAALFVVGLLLWSAKDITDANVQKNFGYAMLVSTIIGLILAIYGSVPSVNVIRLNSWMPIVSYAFFVLGYAFMLFLKPKMKE